MAVSVGELRARVATAVAGISGWALSSMHYAAFARGTRPYLHQTAAVGLLSSRHEDRGVGRASSLGTLRRTVIAVGYAWRIRAGAQAADYDAAVDAIDTVSAAVFGMALTGITSIRLLEVAEPAQRGDDVEHIVIRMTFEILHLSAR